MDSTFFLLMSFMCALSTNPEFKRAKSCYVSVGYNIDYQGDVDRTETGAKCVQWRRTTWESSDFDGTMENNFCRNPDKDPRGPWCIVKSGKRQHCSIPKCASSASFDGKGNIDHELYDINSTTSDTISFAFYTDTQWQNDATILSIKSWIAGELNIKLQSNIESEVKDVIKLQWSFERNGPRITLTTRPNIAATGSVVRVNITRRGRRLKMTVNEEEYTSTITEEVSSDGLFREPGNIFIGKSPYGNNGFRGCISDFSFNNIRTLDMAMGSRHKPEDETISISRGVWEGCLLIPPSDWQAPAIQPTVSSVEVAEMTIDNDGMNSHGARTLPATLPLTMLCLIWQYG